MKAPIRVSFVCLGNICRSPTAEGVMAHLVREAGRQDQIQIESAGTASYHVGERADPRSRAAARDRGIPLPSRARQFEARDFERLDFVLAMDQENLRVLEALRAETSATTHLSLLRDFDPLSPSGSDVPDPYYGGSRGFENVLGLCEAACRGLLARIESQIAADLDSSH